MLKGLYPIADAACIGKNKITMVVEEVLSTGIEIIQYRDKINSEGDRYKTAKELKILTDKYQAKLIINDDIFLARYIDADGVHIGKYDYSIEKVMNILGSNKIMGVSCYNQIEKALLAQSMGATYVSFGSFYKSSTKPNAVNAPIEIIKQAKKVLNIPVCAIGGINYENMSPIITAGADMLAVISAIFEKESPDKEIKKFLSYLLECNLIA